MTANHRHRQAVSTGERPKAARHRSRSQALQTRRTKSATTAPDRGLEAYFEGAMGLRRAGDGELTLSDRQWDNMASSVWRSESGAPIPGIPLKRA